MFSSATVSWLLRWLPLLPFCELLSPFTGSTVCTSSARLVFTCRRTYANHSTSHPYGGGLDNKHEVRVRLSIGISVRIAYSCDTSLLLLWRPITIPILTTYRLKAYLFRRWSNIVWLCLTLLWLGSHVPQYNGPCNSFKSLNHTKNLMMTMMIL